MVEAAEQYKARLGAYVEGKDPVAMQSQTSHTLARLVDGVGETQLSRKPAPNKWSVTEILAHMAADELRSTWRYRQILEHDAPELLGFDQEMWARLGAMRHGILRKRWKCSASCVKPTCGTRQADRASVMSPHGSP